VARQLNERDYESIDVYIGRTLWCIIQSDRRTVNQTYRSCLAAIRTGQAVIASRLANVQNEMKDKQTDD